MNKIFLISCVKSKRSQRIKAELLYTSPLFSKSLSYAKKQNPKDIFILSAKHDLLCLDDVIEPYEKTLNDMGGWERREWSKNVVKKLSQKTDLKNDHFTLLAGKSYVELLKPHIKHYSEPLRGMSIGHRLSWLNSHLENNG